MEAKRTTQSWAKDLEQSKEIKQKFDRKRKL